MSEAEIGEGKYWAMIHPGGPGGVLIEKPQMREQDAEAESATGYLVVFFPKITGIGNASLKWPRIAETLSQTPEAAISKFMDGIAKSCTWATYHDAGHRVRKVQITDLGDAETQGDVGDAS